MSVAINSSPAGALSRQGNWKRRASENEDERLSDSIKRAKYSWYVTLESESPTPTDEDDESIYSMQENETEFARDTSDTTTHTWVSSSESEVSVHVEYELDSQTDNEDPFMEISSSSEPENILAVEFITVCDTEGLADDSDDSRSSIDSEIKRADFWTCAQCKNRNNNPLFRFCEKCYQERKTHFPRSKPRRKPRVPKDQRKRILRTNSSVSSTQELCEMDSGIASSQCEQDSILASSQDTEKPLTDSQSSELTLFNSQTSEATTVMLDSQGSDIGSMSSMRSSGVNSRASDRDEVDSGLAPKDSDLDERSMSSDSERNDTACKGPKLTKDESQTKSDVDKSKDSESTSTQPDKGNNGNVVASIPNTETERKKETQDSDGLCNICIERPKNGVFIHGRTSHICSCYHCALKIWMKNGNRCPICNRKVAQIIKAFYV